MKKEYHTTPQEELAELSPLLAQLKKPKVSLPGNGFFEGIQHNVLAKAQAELNPIPVRPLYRLQKWVALAAVFTAILGFALWTFNDSSSPTTNNNLSDLEQVSDAEIAAYLALNMDLGEAELLLAEELELSENDGTLLLDDASIENYLHEVDADAIELFF